MNCEAVINEPPHYLRFSHCRNAAKFKVIKAATIENCCGVHVKRWRKWEGVTGPLGVTIAPLWVKP